MSMPWGAGPARLRTPRTAARTSLQVVPQVRGARANHFLLLVAGLLVGGLVGLLLLNLSMQKSAFELAAIQQRTVLLNTEEQALSYDLQRLESTSRLARRATQLGMVRNDNPVFLDLTDGSVIGNPVPAPPPVLVAVPEAGREKPEDSVPPTDERGAAGPDGDAGGAQENRHEDTREDGQQDSSVRSQEEKRVAEDGDGTRSRR
jgi:hypothetical protein